MGLFGGKKQQDTKKNAEREKPTTARRSRRIVQPGATKRVTQPGGTKERSPEAKVKRGVQPSAPVAPDPVHEEVLDLDAFASAPPPARAGAPAPLPVSDVPDLDFQGDLGGPMAEDLNGPSRGGDAALIEFLVNKVELISDEQAQNAMQRANDEGLALDAALVLNGSITESDLVAALTKECWVPHLKVDKYEIRKKALSTISLEDIQRFGVFPVDKLGSILNLAMINPLDDSAIQHIDSKTGLEVKIVVTSRSEFQACVDKYFGNNGLADEAVSGSESRMFSQDLPAATTGVTQQLANANVSEIPAANSGVAEGLPEDDFMDIADIDDLLGDGDEVAPALIEPVALEPLDEEPSLQSSAPAADEDMFHDFTDTAALTPEPEAPALPELSAPEEPAFAEPVFEETANAEPVFEEAAPAAPEPAEEVLDLEFTPETAPAGAPEPATNDSSFLEDLAAPEPTPAPAAPTPLPEIPAPLPEIPVPAPQTASPAARSPSRSATRSFTAPKPGSLDAPSSDITDLIPVTEDEFQQSIAHGRVRIFEKWVGIQTRNRIINATAVDEELDPLLEGLKEGAYAIEGA